MTEIVLRVSPVEAHLTRDRRDGSWLAGEQLDELTAYRHAEVVEAMVALSSAGYFTKGLQPFFE
jgi:hypothetical protein